MELKDYIQILRKRLILIVSVILATCLLTGLISFFVLDPTYQASTKLIVNKTNENTTIGQVDINSVNLNIRLIDTYKEIIKTSAIMDKVVAEHPEFGLTSEQLTRLVRVSSVNNTQVMTLSVQDESYAKAANIVNAVSNVFIKEIPSIIKVDNVSLLAAADPEKSPSPVKPRPVLNLAIAFIVSAIAAIGVSLLLEYLDDSIRTESDVEQYLGFPTIGTIPKVKEEELKDTRKQAETNRGREHHVHVQSKT